MKNLKKVLALALAIALSLTMFAGAAFTDQEEINKTEAVDTLVALGVINGMPDGSFNPDGNVTRAEMAKMIYAVRMRGNTDAGNFAGLSTSFTDLYDDWYKGYVKWAQAAGIIDGLNATTFNPNGSVTGTEAAKMLLVLAGYTSDRAGLTGVNWETNTIRYASQAGLLDNMDNVDLSQALPREYAAQLIYNALFIPMVRWSNDSQSFEELTDKVQAGDYDENSITTIGLQYMDLRFFDSIFEGNYQTGATGREGYVEFVDTDDATNTAVVEYDMDLAWIGEEVTVLYQDNNLRGDTGDLDPDDTIYGVTKTGNTTAYSITKADLQDANAGKIKFGGTNYNAASTIDVYINYVESTDSDAVTSGNQSYTAADFDKTTGDIGQFAVNSADTIKFVANENGEINKAYIIDKTVSQIVSMSADKVTIRGTGFGVLDIEDDNVTLYEGAAVDDYVYCYSLYTNDEEIIVEQATVLEDQEVTAIKGDEITIDGVAYDQSAESNNTDMTIVDTANMDAGDNYTVVLYGDQWVAAKASDTSIDDYALVTAASEDPIDGLRVRLLFADNTTGVYTVDEDYTAGITDANAANVDGQLVGYSINDNNVVRLYDTDADITMTPVNSTSAEIEYTSNTKTLTVNNGSGATNYIAAAGAVAFLKDADDEWAAYSVDSLANQSAVVVDKDSQAIAIDVYTAVKNNRLVAFAFDLGGDVAGADGDDLYGWVMDDPSSLKDYKTLPVWNGEETIEVRFDSNATLANAKGSYIKIENFNAEKEYSNTDYNNMLLDTTGADTTLSDLLNGGYIYTKIDSVNNNFIVLTNEQVEDEDGTKTTSPTVQGLTMADDCQIIGVNREDEVGYQNPTLQPYTDIYGEDYNNVLVVTNDDGEVIVIFIDANNNINDTGNYA